MIVTIALSFLFREFSLPRSVILMSHTLTFLLLFIWKFFIIRYNQYTKGKAVIIGNYYEFSSIKENIKKLFNKKESISFIEMNDTFAVITKKLAPYEVIFVSSSVDNSLKNKILYYAMRQNKNVFVMPTVSELLLMKSTITTLDDTMLLQVKPFYINGGFLFIKRLFDIIFSILLLVLSLPVMILTALFIKFEDGGSIFYKQERLGKNNKPFRIIKFRSMRENAERESGPILALNDDHRITKIGNVIRKTRIDELPQLFNVLKGDMSIVGPRPERDFFAENFQKENIWFSYRCAVKPGITGYAQIMGSYTTDMENKLKFDLHYIRNYSLWLDMIIILRTILVVINKAKADGQVARDAQKKSKPIFIRESVEKE
ncbi:sugar transferase [Halalkalibacter okhensis]|uniref:sugar transferase n=1 Tax=Halalkalibacter okhensis TaxID=333138 RepID=UPI000AAAFA97|nr:sugar transferase [Halalkalibacter okhensis]